MFRPILSLLFCGKMRRRIGRNKLSSVTIVWSTALVWSYLTYFLYTGLFFEQDNIETERNKFGIASKEMRSKGKIKDPDVSRNTSALLYSSTGEHDSVLNIDDRLYVDNNSFIWFKARTEGNLLETVQTFNQFLSKIKTHLSKTHPIKPLDDSLSYEVGNFNLLSQRSQELVENIAQKGSSLPVHILKDKESFIKVAHQPKVLSVFIEFKNWINGSIHDEYYQCTADKHISDLTISSGNIAQCSNNISSLRKPESFNPLYHTYHGMEHRFIIRAEEITVSEALLEWNLSCEGCGQNPKFLSYIHIFEDAVVGKSGDIYTMHQKVIPLMWVQHQVAQNSSGSNRYMVSLNNIKYRLMDETVGFSDNVEGYLYFDVKEVFVISVKWGENFGHSILECLTKLSMYVDFLRNNPDVKIHYINNVPMKKFVSIFNLKNLIVRKYTVAKWVYVPEGNPPVTPSFHYLQLTNYYIKGYIKKHLTNYPLKRDKLIYFRREAKRKLVQDSEIISILKRLAAKHHLHLAMYNDSHPPSFDDTLKLFHSAVLIFGPHGAGLSNALISQPRTSIVEILCPLPWTCGTFRHLAYKLGMRYHGILGTMEKDVVHCYGGLRVPDLEYLSKAIDYMLTLEV